MMKTEAIRSTMKNSQLFEHNLPNQMETACKY